MCGRDTRCFNEQRGVVLIVSLLVMGLLSTLALAFLATAKTEKDIAVNYRNHAAASYAAEAGLESQVAALKSLLGATPTPTDTQLDALTPAALTDPSYTFDNSETEVRRVRTTAPYSYQTTMTGGAYNGLVALTTDYVVTASVAGPRGSRARVRQTIRYMGIPLFQFGAFYGRGVDLELNPGPEMTFTGRIHANSNLYLRANKGLKIDSYATTAGNIYRYVKKDPSDPGTNPQVMDAGGAYQTLNFDHEYDYDFTNPWSSADWATAALSTFGGQVQDSAMGVQEIIPPIPDALYDPNNANVSSHLMIEEGDAGDSPELVDAKLYYDADLRIENGKAYDKAGNSINLNKCGASNIVETETFYDPREQRTVVATEVDVGALTACGLDPGNGILYVHKDDGVSTLGGVRLVNGSQLPSQGFTVVSDNPVYVQGDYNTVNKVPAAVLADAITVLSNAWGTNDYDQKTKDVTSKRPAAPTTVNAAFAMGPAHESEVGRENGQLNNLIRFLEYWNKVDFTYSGSLVALWHSQAATAPGTITGPPTGFGPTIPSSTPTPRPERPWGSSLPGGSGLRARGTARRSQEAKHCFVVAMTPSPGPRLHVREPAAVS